MTGPSEEYRRFAADSSVVLGGLAAILLQLGDPVVARGVASHSSFARDPLKRLRGTLAYVYAVQLGSPEQRAWATRRVDASHARVPGAREADPQLWVAATLARVGAQTHELVWGPMDARLADEVHAASAALGTALQVAPESWPADRAAFDGYWERSVTRLEVGDEARSVAAELLAARSAPWWIRLGMPAARELTAVLLPDSVREAYGIPRHPVRGRLVVALVRGLARATPRRVRELPARRLLGALERS